MRAMGIGELLDAAIKIYRKNFLTLMAISAVVAVPVTLITYWIQISRLNSALANPFGASPGGDIVVVLEVLTIQWIIGRSLLFAPMIHTVASSYVGDKATFGKAWRFAGKKLPAMFWVQFIIGIGLLGAGFVALFVGGIFFAGMSGGLASTGQAQALGVGVAIFALFIVSLIYIKFVFGPAIVMVESERGVKAIGRSERLTKKGYWKVWLTVVLAWTLIWVVTWGLQLLIGEIFPLDTFTFEQFADNYRSFVLFSTLTDLIVEIVLAPFAVVLMVLLYFDARIRIEAMDITFMTRRIASGEESGLDALGDSPSPLGAVPPPPPPMGGMPPPPPMPTPPVASPPTDPPTDPPPDGP